MGPKVSSSFKIGYINTSVNHLSSNVYLFAAQLSPDPLIVGVNYFYSCQKKYRGYPVKFEFQRKQQILFEDKHVPCNIWDIC